MSLKNSQNIDNLKYEYIYGSVHSDGRRSFKSLRDADKTVWYMNALNEGHGYRKKENRDLYQQAVILFLEQHL